MPAAPTADLPPRMVPEPPPVVIGTTRPVHRRHRSCGILGFHVGHPFRCLRHEPMDLLRLHDAQPFPARQEGGGNTPLAMIKGICHACNNGVGPTRSLTASPKEKSMAASSDKGLLLKTALAKAHEAWAVCRTTHLRTPTSATACAVDRAYDDLYDAEDAWKAYEKAAASRASGGDPVVSCA